MNLLHKLILTGQTLCAMTGQQEWIHDFFLFFKAEKAIAKKAIAAAKEENKKDSHDGHIDRKLHCGTCL